MGMSPGDKLGPYEILSLLGTGGMASTIPANTPSLSVDGRRLLVTATRYSSTIDMIEGLEPPTTLWQRLFHRKP